MSVLYVRMESTSTFAVIRTVQTIAKFAVRPRGGRFVLHFGIYRGRAFECWISGVVAGLAWEGD